MGRKRLSGKAVLSLHLFLIQLGGNGMNNSPRRLARLKWEKSEFPSFAVSIHKLYLALVSLVGNSYCSPLTLD